MLPLRLLASPSVSGPIRDTYDTRGYFGQITSSLMLGLITTNPYNQQTSEEIIPELAERWEVGGDGKSVTFNLRLGVVWHDGAPVTSADVAYTFRRAMLPPSATVVSQKALFQIPASVDTPSESTVLITLNRPSVSFVRRLALWGALIYPKHIPDVEVFNRVLIGTGPYVLKDEKAGVSLSVTRNPRYFKAGLPYLDGIDYFILPTDTAQAAFRTGKILAGTGTDDSDFMITQADLIRRGNPNLQSQEYLGPRQDIILNSRNPALADRRVREAIYRGFDRYEFDTVWVEGKGVPLATLMMPASRGGKWALPDEEMRKLPGLNPQTREADLKRAKELLSEAGYGAGLDVRFFVGNSAHYVRGAEAAVPLLRNIGIRADLRVTTTSDLLAAEGRGDFDLAWEVNSNNFDDPGDTLANLVTTGGGRNFGKWSFPKIDQLMEEQDRTFDEAKRRPLIYELQREILMQLPTIPLDYLPGVIFWYPEVKNYPRFYFPRTPGYKWDQVWLDR